MKYRTFLLTLALAVPVALNASEGGLADFVDMLDSMPEHVTVVPDVYGSGGWDSEFRGNGVAASAVTAPFFRPVLLQRGRGHGERSGNRQGQEGHMRPEPGRRRGPMPPPGMGRGGAMPPPPWLMDRMKDLPPEEQEQVLRNSERFQELPKERQEQLLQRLHRFQALPPEQKDMILQRFGTFNRLTPEQRQKAREMLPQWRSLQPDRRQAFLEEFRRMRGMSPEERDNYISGHELDGRFSAEERELLRELNSLEPPLPPPPPPRRGRPFQRDRRR